MGGGNLSLQVHPLTQYIRDHFGMAYTQDESYYMLDAAQDATVYLGLQQTSDRSSDGSRSKARAGGSSDSIPGGKICESMARKKARPLPHPRRHGSLLGRNGVVLEISATPYIFTFKLWDWGRTGLDGRPRPIHLDHGFANIDWSRRSHWVEENLINQFENLMRVRAGVKRERVCIGSSSSKHGGIGSRCRFLTIQMAPSMCSTLWKAIASSSKVHRVLSLLSRSITEKHSLFRPVSGLTSCGPRIWPRSLWQP